MHSTVIMFAFYRHVGKYGPLSHGAKWRQDMAGKPETANVRQGAENGVRT